MPKPDDLLYFRDAFKNSKDVTCFFDNTDLPIRYLKRSVWGVADGYIVECQKNGVFDIVNGKKIQIIYIPRIYFQVSKLDDEQCALEEIKSNWESYA